MSVGQWVKAYHPGIWQVCRVLNVPYELRYSLKDPRVRSTRVTVFVRRLVNAKWRPAFTYESCDQRFIKPLSPDERARLDELLKDKALMGAFERFPAQPVDLVANIPFGLPDPQKLTTFCTRTLAPALASGASMEEVLRALDTAGLAQFVSQFPRTATLQLTSNDHEVRDGEYVFRSSRVLDF